MAYIEEANELMTDATGQSIATAIGNMSATSVGNLAALQTTDKTSLVGAVNEVKNGLTNLVKSAEFTVTTDATGNARLTTDYRKIIGAYVNSNTTPYTLCHARPWWLNNQYTPQLNGTYIEVTTTEDTYNHVKEEEVTGIYYYI